MNEEHESTESELSGVTGLEEKLEMVPSCRAREEHLGKGKHSKRQSGGDLAQW